ncbi:hypothetical protein O181_098309 [Austropuccinia psidii MF-1]|uniref:Reverse transcriptase/retrotransposon-derived protein RNase H-like domain-containing protein n=1 Tax=Austropuccinia psidii MF-1 TaxID=1389203 RepID=A0A9Q3JAZ3_9BASI|nr:hypothetical protein [Austropuccinia psidii MF-1]
MVFSKSEEEHFSHVSTVLSRLRANNLFAKASKCLFHVSSVEYLGYVVSSEGLKMDQEKFQQILNWPPPRNLKALQSFLGFANFYRRFIKNYSKKISSLTSFLKKDSRFPLNEEALRQFHQLKEASNIAPILSHFDPSLPTIVETHASDYALGVVLSKISDSGKHPIASNSSIMRFMTRNSLEYSGLSSAGEHFSFHFLPLLKFSPIIPHFNILCHQRLSVALKPTGLNLCLSSIFQSPTTLAAWLPFQMH